MAIKPHEEMVAPAPAEEGTAVPPALELPSLVPTQVAPLQEISEFKLVNEFKEPAPKITQMGVVDKMYYPELADTTMEDRYTLEQYERDKIKMNLIERDTQKRQRIKNVLDDATTFVQDKVKAIKDIASEQLLPKTPGELFVATNFPSVQTVFNQLDEASKKFLPNEQGVANVFDFHYVTEQSRTAQALNAGYRDFNEWMKTNSPMVLEMPADLFKRVLNSDAGKFIARNIELQMDMKVDSANRLADFINRTGADYRSERQRDDILIADRQKQYGLFFGKILGELETSKDPRRSVWEVAKIAYAPVEALLTYQVPIQTPKEFAQFVSMIPYEKSPELDEIGVEFVNHLFNTQKEGYVSPEFKKMMEKRYGPDWDWKLAAFSIKEFGVDAAILSLAAKSEKIAEAAWKGTANLTSGFNAAITRSILLGIGGGGVQSGLNLAAGQEHSDIVAESYQRTVGAMIGEGFVALGRGAYKTVQQMVSDTTAKIAAKYNLPVYHPNVQAGRPGADVKTPLANEVVNASIYGDTQMARNIRMQLGEMHRTTDPEQYRAIAENLRKITGMGPEELDNLWAFGHGAYEGVKKQDIYFDVVNKFGQASEDAAVLQGRLSKLADAIEKLQARPAVRPATMQKRQAVIAELERERQKVQQDLTNTTALRGQLFMQKKDMETEFNKFTTGSMLSDKIILNEAMGLRIMGEAAMPTPRQQAVNDIFFVSNQGGEFAFRPATRNPGGFIRHSLTRWFGEPDRVLPDTALAKDYQHVVRQMGRTANEFQNMLKASLKGLRRGEVDDVWRVIDEGADLEKLFSVEDLTTRGLNLKQIDAYYAIRKTLDLSHFVDDSVATREFIRLGYKELPDGKLVKPTKVGLTKEQRARGEVNYVAVRRGQEDLETGSILESQLKDPVSIIRYVEGYVPRVYKDARWHVSVIDTKTKTIRRLDGFDTYAKARDFLSTSAEGRARSLTPDYDEAVDGARFITFAGRWNEGFRKGEVGFGRNSIKLLDVAEDGVIKNIQEALKRAGREDIGIDNLRVLFDDLNMSSLKRKFIGERGEEGLRSLQLKPSEEAVVEYLDTVAQRAGGLNDWRVEAQNRFLETYGPKGYGILGPGQNWDTPLPKPWQVTSDRWFALADARQMQAYMQRVFTGKTRLERGLEQIFNNLTFKLSEGNASQRAFAKWTDGSTLLTSFIGGSRGIGAQFKLGFFNPSQLMVQSLQALYTAGAYPGHIVGGLKDVYKVAGAHVLNQTGVKPRGEFAKLLSDLTRSGFAADISTTDMVTIARGGRASFARLMEQYGAKEGIGEGVKQNLSGIVKRGLDAGMSPFKAGEAFNRVLAFMTVRRSFMEQYAKGTLKGIDGMPFKGQIGDDEFLRLVSDQANVTALNMTKSGQLELMSGLGSVAFQFAQVFPKTISMFTSKELSPAQRLGAAAVGIGVLGPQAIPGLTDLWNFVDDSYWQLTGGKPSEFEYLKRWAEDARKAAVDYVVSLDPVVLKEWGVDQKFLDNLTTKGYLYAATDAEIDLVNRLALGRFVGEMADNMDQAKYPILLSLMAGVLETDTASIGALLSLMVGGTSSLTPEQATAKSMTELGRTISTFNYLGRFLENLDRETFDPSFRKVNPFQPHTIKTSRGQETGVPATEGRLIQYLVGLTPGPVVNRLETYKKRAEVQRAIEDYMKDQLKRYVEAEGFPEKRLAILRDTDRELTATERFLDQTGLRTKDMDQNWKRKQMDKFRTFLMQRSLSIPRTMREIEQQRSGVR